MSFWMIVTTYNGSLKISWILKIYCTNPWSGRALVSWGTGQTLRDNNEKDYSSRKWSNNLVQIRGYIYGIFEFLWITKTLNVDVFEFSKWNLFLFSCVAFISNLKLKEKKLENRFIKNVNSYRIPANTGFSRLSPLPGSSRWARWALWSWQSSGAWASLY